MVDLRARLAAGLAWKAAGQLTMQLVRVVGAIVLARLLTPHEYGLAGAAFAALALAGPFADLALGTALVQRPRLTEDDRSTIFWTNLAAGVTLTVLGVALAEPIAAFFGEPEVAGLVRGASAGFALAALGATHGALLTRELRFGALEAAAVAGTVTGVGAAIALAAAGAGAWALVAQGLVSAAIVAAVVSAASGWRPHARFSRASLRELGGFGAQLLGTRVLFTAHRNVDNILVGRVLGTGDLGRYALAYNISLMPMSRVVDPARDVLLPALSRLQEEPARVASAWLRATRLVILGVAPLLLVLAATAPDFTRVVLGTRWDDAADPLAVLCAVAALQSAIALNSVVLPALGMPGRLLRFAVLTFVLSVAGFAAGLPFGVTGVAVGYLAANVVLVPAYLRLVGGVLDVAGGRTARALAGPAAVAVAAAAAALVVRLALDGAGAPAGARLAAAAAAGAAVALLAAWRWTPDAWHEVRALLRARSDQDAEV